MRVKVLKLDVKLFDGEATMIVLPAANGEICLLPEHISIITSIRKGSVKIFKPDVAYPTVIETDGNGVCSFSDDKAIFIL